MQNLEISIIEDDNLVVDDRHELIYDNLNFYTPGIKHQMVD